MKSKISSTKALKIEIGKEIAKDEFINEEQLLSAQTLLSKQIAKGKQFTEERAIQFLADNLDLSPDLSKAAYQNVIMHFC